MNIMFLKFTDLVRFTTRRTLLVYNYTFTLKLLPRIIHNIHFFINYFKFSIIVTIEENKKFILIFEFNKLFIMITVKYLFRSSAIYAFKFDKIFI